MVHKKEDGTERGTWAWHTQQNLMLPLLWSGHLCPACMTMKVHLSATHNTQLKSVVPQN